MTQKLHVLALRSHIQLLCVMSREIQGSSAYLKTAYVCILGLTLQFSIHCDVREAAQHSHDFIVLLLPQETQHTASVRILETHQVLQASNLVLDMIGNIMD